jgi:hypothetical protein
MTSDEMTIQNAMLSFCAGLPEQRRHRFWRDETRQSFSLGIQNALDDPTKD